MAIGTGAALGLAALPGVAGCATSSSDASPWEARLRGDTVALLGEIHDNAEHHERRLAVLRRALRRGWRPAVAMEQFDGDRQADIERARRERPGDAGHLIAQSTSQPGGWDWSLYRPVVQLVLDHDLPLLAANLPRREAMRLVREDFAVALGVDGARALGLDGAVDAAWLDAHRREVEKGHCGAMPVSMLAGMARAQLARDAHMASVVQAHARRGAVLLAGNGHVRRDIGVPRWLARGMAPHRVWSVGFLERSSADAPAGMFDAVVVTADAARAEDPCARLRARPRGS